MEEEKNKKPKVETQENLAADSFPWEIKKTDICVHKSNTRLHQL